MSVILDALRRARTGRRTGSTPPEGMAREVPAGLRVDPGKQAVVQETGRPRPFVIAFVVLVAAAVWAAVQYSLPSDTSGVEPPRAAATPTSAVPPPGREVAAALPAGSPDARAAEGPDARTPPRNTRFRPRGASSPVVPSPVPPGVSPAAASQPPPAAGDRIAGSPRTDHFALGLRYHSLGDFEQALQHYLAALQEDEFNIEARNNLGLLYHQRGLHQEAIEQFRRALLVNPRYVRARSNLGVALTSAGRLAEARAELREALSIEPRNADLLVNLALVEKADGQPEKAIEVLLRSLGVQPTHAAANYNIGVLYEERASLARAYDHYSAFLEHAGPEHGALLRTVEARVQQLGEQLGTPAARLP